MIVAWFEMMVSLCSAKVKLPTPNSLYYCEQRIKKKRVLKYRRKNCAIQDFSSRSLLTELKKFEKYRPIGIQFFSRWLSRNSYLIIREREHATVDATRCSVASLLIWGGGFAACEKRHCLRWCSCRWCYVWQSRGAAGVNDAQAADASVFPISFVTDAKYTYVSSLGWSLKWLVKRPARLRPAKMCVIKAEE